MTNSYNTNHKRNDLKKNFWKHKRNSNYNECKKFIDILEDHINFKLSTNQITARTFLRDKDTVKLIKKTCMNFVNLPINVITVDHIRNALPKMTCYSNNTIKKIYTLINKTFKIALSDRLISFNPMDNENICKNNEKLIDNDS